MFLLESWDVANSLVVTVTLAHDKSHDWPAWVADVYVLVFCVTLLTFQMTYPFWTSLGRIAFISLFNDIVTDGPMIFMMAKFQLFQENFICSLAFTINCFIGCFACMWILKWCMQPGPKLMANNPRLVQGNQHRNSAIEYLPVPRASADV